MSETKLAKEENKGKQMEWVRKAFSREETLAVRKNGSPRNPCFLMKIYSRKNISKSHLNCARNKFLQKSNCFPVRVTPNEADEELCLAKTNSFSTTLKKIPYEEFITLKLLEEVLGEPKDADDDIMKIFYTNLKKQNKKLPKSFKHSYQFVVSFHTGVYDEVSSAFILNIFLAFLDVTLSNGELKDFSHINLYDDGLYIEEQIVTDKSLLVNEKDFREKLVNMYMNLLDHGPSNFTFPNDQNENEEIGEYRSRRVAFSQESTVDFLCICKENDASVYATIFSAINSSLFYLAQVSGMEEEVLTMNVLHKINGKYAFQPNSPYSMPKLGFHTVPVLHGVSIDDIDLGDLFKNAHILEATLTDFIANKEPSIQEALRQIVSEETKVSTRDVMPNCFYTLSNLGDMEELIPESRANLKVSGLGRANSCHEWSFIDFTFYTLRRKLVICADYCTKRTADSLIESMMDLVHSSIESLL